MKQLPISIIWKSVQIRFADWWSQKINKIKKINWNTIIDEKWNSYHINLEKIWSIFEPKSENYTFKDFKEFDDFGDLK